MKTIILFLGMTFCLSVSNAQTIHTVDNRPGTTAQFTSVQAAHDAAQPGDFIYVHPSPIDYGNLTISKTIHLRGIGHGPELANGEYAQLQTINLHENSVAATSASNSTISGLNITNLSQATSSFNFSNILIQNNRINYMYAYRAFNFIVQGNVFVSTNSYSIIFSTSVGTHANNIISHNIFIRNSTSQTDAVIQGLISSETFNNNIVVFNNPAAVTPMFKDSSNPIVNNNLFLFGSTSATSTALALLNSSVTFQNCLTNAYGGQTIAALSGTANLDNTDPQFTDIGSPENPAFAYTKNYKLAIGSPAIDAGSDGDDLGIYGQGFLFQMKGYPFDLPYPTSINITNAVVEAGGTLEVSLTAEANVEN